MRSGTLWYILAFLALVGLVGLYGRQRGLLERYDTFEQSERRVHRLERERDTLRNSQEELREYLQDLHSDPVEREAEIRRHGMVREGETVYKVVLEDEQN